MVRTKSSNSRKSHDTSDSVIDLNEKKSEVKGSNKHPITLSWEEINVKLPDSNESFMGKLNCCSKGNIEGKIILRNKQTDSCCKNVLCLSFHYTIISKDISYNPFHLIPTGI